MTACWNLNAATPEVTPEECNAEASAMRTSAKEPKAKAKVTKRKATKKSQEKSWTTTKKTMTATSDPFAFNYDIGYFQKTFTKT